MKPQGCTERIGGWIAIALVAVVLLDHASAQDKRPTRSDGERYALLVAVRSYDAASGLAPLQYPERDMEQLRDVLLDSGYRPENVVLMSQTRGAGETRFLPLAANIRKELTALVRDREPDGSVLVAFAGHGVQFRGSDETYICPADARVSDPKTLVSFKEVYAELDHSKAGFKLLLSDACRNDPFTSSARRATVDLESVTRPQKIRPPGGIAALFGCSDGEVAYESDDLRHGVFFHFVIEGLQGKADLDSDREVAIEELSHYAKRRVSDFVRAKFSGERQMPQLVNNVRGAAPVVRLDPALAAFRRGREHFLAGHFEQAISEYDACLRLGPARADAYAQRALSTWLQARTLYWSGELGDESGVFPREGEPVEKEWQRRRADLRRRIEADLGSARRLDPRSELAEILRIEMLWTQAPAATRDPTRALQQYADFLADSRGSPSDPEVNAVRLCLLDSAPLIFFASDKDLAPLGDKLKPRRTAFERALLRALNREFDIELRPEDVTPRKLDDAVPRKLGRKLTREEQTREAAAGSRAAAEFVIGVVDDGFRSAEQDGRGSFLPYLAKAFVCLDSSFLDPTVDNERAVREATAAIERAPECMLAYLVRAHAQTALKQHERAIEDLTHAIRLRPEGYYLYEKRAAAYRRVSDEAAAAADDQKAATLKEKYGR